MPRGGRDKYLRGAQKVRLKYLYTPIRKIKSGKKRKSK